MNDSNRMKTTGQTDWRKKWLIFFKKDHSFPLITHFWETWSENILDP